MAAAPKMETTGAQNGPKRQRAMNDLMQTPFFGLLYRFWPKQDPKWNELGLKIVQTGSKMEPNLLPKMVQAGTG